MKKDALIKNFSRELIRKADKINKLEGELDSTNKSKEMVEGNLEKAHNELKMEQNRVAWVNKISEKIGLAEVQAHKANEKLNLKIEDLKKKLLDEQNKNKKLKKELNHLNSATNQKTTKIMHDLDNEKIKNKELEQKILNLEDKLKNNELPNDFPQLDEITGRFEPGRFDLNEEEELELATKNLEEAAKEFAEDFEEDKQICKDLLFTLASATRFNSDVIYNIGKAIINGNFVFQKQSFGSN